jgi:hypothetical protein
MAYLEFSWSSAFWIFNWVPFRLTIIQLYDFRTFANYKNSLKYFILRPAIDQTAKALYDNDPLGKESSQNFHTSARLTFDTGKAWRF